MKNIPQKILGLIIVFTLLCCSNNEYLIHFETNKHKFEKLVDYLNSNYIQLQPSKERSIVNCNSNYSDTLESKELLDLSTKYYCDSTISDVMTTLKINLIKLEYNNECDTGSEKSINRIVFRLNQFKPEICYIYNFCKANEPYKSSTYEEQVINNNWILSIDRR